ncbi:CpaF family protein (plasmid) [Pseudosulfitobacter pseudonitzschiae]|uniref:CpaF family protein n=1 Tax=Pseudosulfitobacter pseudonitzschiae TaxID=1402135 RepID=UPI001E4B2603|nr:CpaF family protein [Pseudosulfitobacter pseudonitzschiae]UFG04626.1 CpaF family protein [Pseudosulfitobacter pseudonitzschiae]
MSEGVVLPLISPSRLRTSIEERLSQLALGGGPVGLHEISSAIDWYETQTGQTVPREMQRELLKHFAPATQAEGLAPPLTNERIAKTSYMPGFAKRLNALSRLILPEALTLLDLQALSALPQEAQRDTIRDAVLSICARQKLELNGAESADLVGYVVDDMMGFGPLERLLADDDVSDILVNGPQKVYVERGGKLELTDVSFRDDQHVMNIASRIVSAAGRRVDESTPLVDTRLADGSRINVTIPPLAVDGPTITIRKFPKEDLTLADLASRNTLSPQMAELLRIAAYLRLNILFSGGTGACKTTMLNAVSREIPANERIVTIEDAAELRLQQPHVVRLETRPPTLEGTGEITMRHLFRNALRMRPDRIIIGEVRSDEALDMLQAMNTGHDGSMSTLHANTPREALTRMENLIAMSGVQLSTDFVRDQLKEALHLVVQISRMHDGVRRVTSIAEVVGMEGNTISMQELFVFKRANGRVGEDIVGEFQSTRTMPHFIDRAKEHGLDEAIRDILVGNG